MVAQGQHALSQTIPQGKGLSESERQETNGAQAPLIKGGGEGGFAALHNIRLLETAPAFQKPL